MTLKKLHGFALVFFSRLSYFKMKNLENGSLWFSMTSWEAVSGCQSDFSWIHLLGFKSGSCDIIWALESQQLQHYNLSLIPQHKE